MSENVFILSSYLIDGLVGYVILGWEQCFLGILKALLHDLLTFKAAVESSTFLIPNSLL